MTSFRRILVGWDGSTDARHSLQTALSLAGDVDAEVVVLTVLSHHEYAESAHELSDEVARERDRILDELRAELKRERVPESVRLRHEVVEADHPSQGLNNYSHDHGFDLIVVGRRGVDCAVNSKIGGVCEYQVRHSECPVMVVG